MPQLNHIYELSYIHLAGMDSDAVRTECDIQVHGEDVDQGGPNVTWRKLMVNNCREWKPSIICF